MARRRCALAAWAARGFLALVLTGAISGVAGAAGPVVTSFQINNGAAHVMSALHVNELWTDFTSLKVTNHDTAKPVRLTWVIAGL